MDKKPQLGWDMFNLFNYKFMKKKWFNDERPYRPLFKWIRVMKLTLFFLLAAFVHVSASVYSQQTKLSISVKDATVKEVLKQIEEQSEFYFLYKNVDIDVNRVVSIDEKEKSVESILNQIFSGTTVTYEVVNRQIVLVDKGRENSSLLSQQQKSVSGKVTDSSGDPIPGVSIVVKGTTTGIITNSNGDYSLSNIPENAILQFSFMGMKMQTISVGNKTTINVALELDMVEIEEVVAVGYGVQKKTNLTGAVSSISGEQMIKRPVTNPLTMLQGQVAGLQIVQGLGQPGDEAITIRIRGEGTYSSAGSNPLVLIDGVAGSLANLNPNDIENVSVLKDAASASIYGARAANGVIIVTTKNGAEGTLKIEYNGNFGVNTPASMLKLVTNSADYMMLFNEAKTNSGVAANIYPQDVIDLYKNATDRVKYPNFDWLDYMFNPAVVINHNLSLSGGTKGTLYNVSLGYVDQPGTMLGFNFKKYNLRINLKAKIKPWATIGANMSFGSGYRNNPPNGQTDAFLSSIAQAPTYGPFLSDGSGRYTSTAYSWEGHNKNMGAIIDAGTSLKTINFDLFPQLWADIQILKGLNWYTKGAANLQDVGYKDARPKAPIYMFNTGLYMGDLNVGTLGVKANHNQNFYLNFYSYLKYVFNLHANNHFSAQLGYSQEYNKYNYVQAYRKDYISSALQEVDAGTLSIQTANGSENEWAIMSMFGRLNYDYKGKYLIEANIRRDGTSRIAKNSRWGWFPSVSAGWSLTKENYIKNLRLNWLNSVKVRGSYGLLGNQNIGTYPYQALLSFVGNYTYDNTNLMPGVAQTAFANTEIKWESTSIADIGVDLQLFKGLNITYDWYYKHTFDILRRAQVLSLMGLSAPIVNSGEMENRGHEITVKYTNNVKNGLLGGLTYGGGFTFDRFRNKLVNFGAKEIGTQAWSPIINQNNSEYNAYYLLKNIGVFQTTEEIASSPKQFSDNVHPGDFKYADTDGNGIVNENDRVVVSGRYPKFQYSFNGNASWKGFDISILFQGVSGRKTYATGWGYEPFRQGSAPTTDWLTERWTGPGTSNHKPRLYYDYNGDAQNRRPNTYYLLDLSYLRMKNLTIGFTVPSKLILKINLQRIRVYFSGDNLFTSTKFPGLDPERPTGDGNFVQYPQNKVVSFGITIDI
ncbi:MAG: TonB-dependent receptor [Prolixibacteraceae bacterium]|nr:TonB-dependent receptor [Prolixibacteraceae bacterium]